MKNLVPNVRFVPFNRRDLLRVGSIGVSASLWPGLSPQEASAGEMGPAPKAQSVILLWMAGGVTHHDSLDPKPESPEEIRGTLSTIATRLPGVHFAESCPNLAAIADRFCLVRSFSHDSNDHLLSQAYCLSGRKVTMQQITSEPNIGSIVAHLKGPRNGLPGYIAVPGVTRPGPPPVNEFVGGWLGGHLAPFCVGGEPDQPDFTVGEKSANPSPLAIEDLAPKALALLEGLNTDRVGLRSQLRGFLDQVVGDAEKRGAMDGHYRAAFELLASPAVRQAFDVSQEPDAMREAYGRTKLGGRCLLARRLVEAGARFVMVDYGYDPEYGNLWDNHAVPEQKQPHISQMAMRGYHVAGMDKAFGGLLTDLERRGLLKATLVVFLTEFGRTPKINALGGRDHWGPAGSIFFAGAGVRAGQVIGATDKQGAFPLTRGFSPGDVAATIYRAIGIDPTTRLFDLQRRPHFVLPEGEPIADVLS
ncbi:MAG TPA: DUF1501 domain-containing protein [Pirellulales bacterium]|nr:DUF1501 domain-containing protein [Pirellulales bacterium]